MNRSCGVEVLEVASQSPQLGYAYRSPTKMEEHDLTPNEMLELHDDPVNWEYPPGFDYGVEQKRFLEFADAFFTALNLNPRTETGICIQDASFHSQLMFTVDGGRNHTMRFSNFGSFVTVNDDEDLPGSILTAIRELADRFGYTYIPYQCLDADYSGTNPGVTGIDSWWIRYFDYV